MHAPRLIFSSVLLGAFVSGCMVGPDYHRPATTMPASFSAAAPATQPSPAVDVTQWWKSLNDPKLNALVDRAVKGNPDLQIALMRLQEARLQESATAGIALPDLDAVGAVARGTGVDSVKGLVPGSLRGGEQTSKLREVTEIAGVDAVWNLDVFGGLRRELEAARYDTQAAAEARNDVLTALIANVVLTYADERATQMRLNIAQADARLEQSSTSLVQSRYDRGFTNELDPELAQRELASVRAEIAPLQAAVEQDQRRLSFLVGEFPGSARAELSGSVEWPQVPSQIEPGLPVELLKRRPDIRLAERQLASQRARIGVAVDALYPHVFISGAAGVQGQGFGRTPLEASFIGTIGPGAYWSLLDFGTLDALVEKQDYVTRQALLNYQRTVLAAVEETDDAIRNFSYEQDRLSNLGDALAAAQRAEKVASQRYDRGFTNYLDVLDAQRELYAIQDEYAVTLEQVLVQFVAVYKALGGGWENYQSIPPVRQPLPAVMAIISPGYSTDDNSGH